MARRLTKSTGRKTDSGAAKQAAAGAGKAKKGAAAASSSKARAKAPSKSEAKSTAPKATQAKAASGSADKPKPAKPAKPTGKSSKPEKGAASARVEASTPESTDSAKSAKKPAAASKKDPNNSVRAAVSTIRSGHTEKLISSDRKSDLKAQFAKLSTATTEISGLKRSINRTFYDVGLILNRIREERLYEIKGYGSFESFVEREIDINKAVCLRSARIAEAITREEAVAAGLERASAAVAALDGELEAANVRPAGSPVGAVPLHKQ